VLEFIFLDGVGVGPTADGIHKIQAQLAAHELHCARHVAVTSYSTLTGYLPNCYRVPTEDGVNDVEFLADQLQRAYRGPAWHGPAVREVLDGVGAMQASAKPAAGGHSIWEIVTHMGAWISEVKNRLGREAVELSGPQDWPPVDGSSEAAWQQTLSALDQEQEQLRSAIASLPEANLRTGVSGEKYSVRFMLEGVIQHNLYHAGQIAMLKKMS
jgi:uncharacterized damage-inducible protein DinB